MKIRSFLPLLTYPDASSEASIRNAAALASLASAELPWSLWRRISLRSPARFPAY
jgi:hypothetical protein